MSFNWQESMVSPFVTIHNLEYIIFNLNIKSDKLLKIFPMNQKFLDDFNQGVIGYYIGLIGVYFAVLIVVIQMYKDKRYLGKEISKKILIGGKNNISMVRLIWVISAFFIVITIFFKQSIIHR